ncbi:MAG: hypothetical protein AAF667_12610 [Pseudomonadota bacterium]
MTIVSHRYRVNALAIIASSAFAGGNLFIGLSMGTYWLSLDPIDFMNGFGPQFQRFLFTIMPLFLLTLLGIVLSLRLDNQMPALRRIWWRAILAYVLLSLITLGYHMPENLRLLAAEYTAAEAEASRTFWLLGHVPRVILGFCIPWFVFQAIAARSVETVSDLR